MQTRDSFTAEVVPSVLTIGVFDGVHVGHQALIERMVESARATGRRAVVVTFYPYPYVVLGHAMPYYLTTTEEKLVLFEQLGVDLSVVLEFTPEMARTPAAAFVDWLVGRVGMTELWVGHDFALGYRREGNVAYLRQAGARLGFGVNELDATALEGEIISSSRIREALRAGDVVTARRFLGRPYRLTGAVVEGAKRGRTIGIPTANLDVQPEKAVPLAGVYACFAHAGRSSYQAVTNIGTRPTFDNGAPTIEAHLLDFEGDLYGQTLSLEFIARLRGEQRFKEVTHLVAQIHADISAARQMLNHQP